MTYEQTIAYLYDQLPMFSRIGAAAYKEDLYNTVELCNALGNPQDKFRSVHVAGTNGKGSTSHMLAAIFQEAGYKTGLYTSPHIKAFGERIRINGQMVNQKFVTAFVEKTKDISDRVKPSFFELTVAMAFQYFAEEKVDIAIIETGLGGRLDSTNIINPVLSVITNIGFDHMNLLGETLPKIAWEKAGIIKKNIPVVVGETLPETLPIFMQKAHEMGAAIYIAPEKYIVQYAQPADSLLLCNVLDTSTGEEKKFRLDLTGIYQLKNICTVLQAVDVLRKTGFVIPGEALHNGLMHVKKLTGLAGRWDIIQSNPTVILDVAHNEDGIRQVLHQLRTDYPSSKIHFILGFVNDKDVSKVLNLFPVEGFYYFTNAHIPRALPYAALKQMAGGFLLNGQGYEHVLEALAAAKENAAINDVIMICGSFFIVAEVDR